jgi:hypothetical protein
MRKPLLLVLCLLLTGAAQADVLDVPADYPTIQAAIDAANPGDEIVIAAGTYDVAKPHELLPGGLTFRGVGEVVLTGSTDAFFDVTAPENLDLFRFENLRFVGNPTGIRTPTPVNPFPETRLEVEGCTFLDNEVGIDARNTGQFWLTNCRFEGGTIGVELRFAWLFAQDCVFVGAENAIRSDEGLADRLVDHCLFVDCYGYYGAVTLDGDAEFILNQCTFDRCGAEDGAAISSRQGAVVTMDRCIVANGPGLAFGCIAGLPNHFIVTCSDLWNNAGGNWHACGYGGPEDNGNFSADPRFCAPELGDYGVQAGSPCDPADNACELLVGAYEVGCESTATLPTSFGAVKSLY